MDFIDFERYCNEAGIYQIRQISNGRLYIGQTSQSFKKRYWFHRSQLRRHMHDNRYLQSAWDKYGEDDFEFSVVEVCERDKTYILEREVYYIQKYGTFGDGFNLTVGGEGASGYTPSAETRRKIGQANREHMLGRKHTEETKAKMRQSSRHLSPSPETREAVSRYMKHRVVSEDTKAKLRRCNSGSQSSFAVINEECAMQIKQRLIAGQPVKDIATDMNLNYNLVGCISRDETWKDVYVHGWNEYCEAQPQHKHSEHLSDDIVRSIRSDIASGITCQECVLKYGISLSRVYCIKNRKCYKNVI